MRAGWDLNTAVRPELESLGLLALALPLPLPPLLLLLLTKFRLPIPDQKPSSSAGFPVNN